MAPPRSTSPPVRNTSSWKWHLVAIAIAVGVFVAAAAVPSTLKIPDEGVVTVTGATFTYDYTNGTVANNDGPISAGLSWSGSSSYPLSAPAGGQGVLLPGFENLLRTNCTLLSISVAAPFHLNNVTVSDNQTHWRTGYLPTTIEGRIFFGTNWEDWNVNARLALGLPDYAGDYDVAITASVAC